MTSTCPSQDIPMTDLRFWIPGLAFSNVHANRTGTHTHTHIKMNVIIIPLAGHYRRFLFLFLCVNLFKRKLFVTTICSLKKSINPIFFFKKRMVEMVSLGLRFSPVGLSPVCVAGKPMASSLGWCRKPAEGREGVEAYCRAACAAKRSARHGGC